MSLPIRFRMRDSLLKFLIICIVSVSIMKESQYAQTQDTSDYPSPIVLLDGVVVDRVAIPPSSLKLEIVTEDNVSIHTNTYQVDFDKERRRYRLEKDGQKIYDGIYNGQQVISYRIESKEAEFRDIIDGSGGYSLFDPRLLGSVAVYSPRTNAENFMYQGQRERFTTIETKGKVEINGNDAWHVRIVTDGEYPLDLWIDPSRNFRIYKMIAGAFRVTKSISFYEDDLYPWLPRKVIEDYFEANGSLIYHRTRTLLEAEEKDFPESHWTLAGMDLPRGTVINDYSKAERLGYWDGKKISKEFVPRDRKPSRKTQWTFILSLAVLITVIFWIGMLKKQKKQP